LILRIPFIFSTYECVNVNNALSENNLIKLKRELLMLDIDANYYVNVKMLTFG